MELFGAVQDEFLKLLSFLFLQSWLSFLAGPLVLILSTIIFFLFLGQKGPVFSFQLLLIFGNFLDIFFETLENILTRCFVFFLHNGVLLRFKRNRCLFMLKLRRFLARFSSFFCQGGHLCSLSLVFFFFLSFVTFRLFFPPKVA